jgi:tetratricopeptide (TPR) repeat protein
VPFLRNPNFTGRDALLEELHAKLTNGRVALTAVRGMGGVGKTQLALEYAYAHAGDFDLVWWLRAEQSATLLEDYAALAEPLGLGTAGEADLAAVANAVCQALARRDRWLLVFDNATGPDDLTGLLPRASAGRVLITSRNPNWPLALPLDVPVLSRDAAIGFLFEHTGDHDRDAADAVATYLGDLPLALAQAAAYMTETGIGLAGYLDLFRTRRRELWAEEKPPAEYSATVGTTMATDRLRANEPLAVDLLNLCAFLAPEAIPRRLFAEHHEILPEELGAAVAEPLRLNRLIAPLRRYSLIEVTGEALSFHRLIQAAARDHLASDETRRWVEAAVALMVAGFPHKRDDPATWGPSGGLLAHALAAADHAEETARDLAGTRQLLDKVAGYFETRAELRKATRLLERARDLAETALGPDHPEVAMYVNNLGTVLQTLGDLAGARAAHERALRIDEASFGPDHSSIARDLNNLGLVLYTMGDLAGARAAFERALKIDEKSFGPDHPEVARDVNNIGGVLQDQGDLVGASAAYERALKIVETTLGPNHPNVASAVNNLGGIMQDLGDLAGARAAYERALRIDEASFGLDHIKVANRVNNLGSALHDLGDLAGARAAYERALRILEKFLPAEHPNIAGVRENLRIVLEEQERSTSGRQV